MTLAIRDSYLVAHFGSTAPGIDYINGEKQGG